MQPLFRPPYGDEGGYPVQYFERQRFEYHPGNAAPYDIEGGLLGSLRARQLGLP